LHSESSLEGMIRATGRLLNRFCVACFAGDYPFEQKAGALVRTARPAHSLVEG
jgi:glutamine phosphoribosylpyrophosphate amidotransferase